MILGRERDGVFISDDAVHVFEFTTAPDKKKAIKDAGKIVEALTFLMRDPSNRFKSAAGWFVTQSEPTAEQAGAVAQIAKNASMTIHCVSYITLRKRICDVEGYLAARSSAPFGSTAYTQELHGPGIPTQFRTGRDVSNVKEVADGLLSGDRYVIVGEFGVGKSFAAREIYTEIRKRHFKRPANNPFPIHVNLRDCAGLRSPAEVLRRHAEDIGFAGERGLISAWRSGAAVLILDGFDEIIPTRWLGSATSLPVVRWDALSAVRKLIQEAPAGTGVVAAGRGHYFNSLSEMQKALGMEEAQVLELDDFDEVRAAQFLALHGAPQALPEWMPTRPLFLSHLVTAGLLEDAASLTFADEAEAWRRLFDVISERESRIYNSVPPYTIRAVLQRLATVAKSHEDGLGRLSISDLEQVFLDVSGRPTDEEVIQMLLRLPGLAAAQGDEGEYRLFADHALAETAYGEDLALYISSPYQGHPLCEPARWPTSAGSLAIEVAVAKLDDSGIVASQVIAACDHRMTQNGYDAILADAIRVAQEMRGKPSGPYIVENVFIESAIESTSEGILSNVLFRECVISEVDITQNDHASACPTFEGCLIGQLTGAQQIPDALLGRFRECDIEVFVDVARTTQSLLSIDTISDESRVALSILNKVYVKRGRGRKDSGLVRGLEQRLQALVSPVVDRLSAAGFLLPVQRRNAVVFVPVARARSEVLTALEAPSQFDLDRFLDVTG